jgi:hypothetical protein
MKSKKNLCDNSRCLENSSDRLLLEYKWDMLPLPEFITFSYMQHETVLWSWGGGGLSRGSEEFTRFQPPHPTPQHESVVFRMPSVCLSVCICVLCQRLNGCTDFFHIRVCKGLSITGWCPVNMDIRARNTETLQRNPQTEYCDFLENFSKDFH